jgi:hypothetical protein
MDSPSLIEASECIKQILDAKYEPANFSDVTAKCTYLTEQQREDLYYLLKKFESLFDGTLLACGKANIMTLNYAVMQNHITHALFQSLKYMNKLYDMKLIICAK